MSDTIKAHLSLAAISLLKLWDEQEAQKRGLVVVQHKSMAEVSGPREAMSELARVYNELSLNYQTPRLRGPLVVTCRAAVRHLSAKLKRSV